MSSQDKQRFIERFGYIWAWFIFLSGTISMPTGVTLAFYVLFHFINKFW